MTAYHESVRRIEEHLMNAWPSLRTVLCDGWVFREAGGYTKRANSASALDARGAFAPTLGQAERFYASFGAPTVFRLTPLAGPEADRILAGRGYRVVDETVVMTSPLRETCAADAAVTVVPECTRAWEDGHADAHGLPDEHRRAHRAILDKIAPLPTGFATAYEDGRAIAFGLGVIERGHLGLFDIVTMPDSRRRGAARRIVTALMDWGAAQAAKTAWLSVIDANAEAKPLYTQLGFREFYRYHYRMADR